MKQKTRPARNAATVLRRSTTGHRGEIALAGLSFLRLTGLFAGDAKSPTAEPDDVTDPIETLRSRWVDHLIDIVGDLIF
ncbi:MAG: hypothetical protein PVF93_11705 [Chromatiaceae bacterium]|jgi:hypothetical protein